MTKEEKMILEELQEEIYRIQKLIEELISQEHGKHIGVIDDIEEKTMVSNSISTVVVERNKIEEITIEQLRELGISANLLGYQYIKEAILLIIKDKSYLQNITKGLYPDIAKKFDTTKQRVERAIRNAVERIFERGSCTKIQQIFSYTITYEKGKATNSEFLAILAEEVEREIRKARN